MLVVWIVCLGVALLLVVLYIAGRCCLVFDLVSVGFGLWLLLMVV